MWREDSQNRFPLPLIRRAFVTQFVVVNTLKRNVAEIHSLLPHQSVHYHLKRLNRNVRNCLLLDSRIRVSSKRRLKLSSTSHGIRAANQKKGFSKVIFRSKSRQTQTFFLNFIKRDDKLFILPDLVLLFIWT